MSFARISIVSPPHTAHRGCMLLIAARIPEIHGRRLDRAPAG
jgi:hypothetical protein